MKMDLELEPGVVTPGEVRVRHVDLVLDTPDVRVWHIDLNSKYAEVLAYSREEVLLYAIDETLRTDEGQRGVPTSVKVNVPEDDDDYAWVMMADCGRYRCRFVAYRMSKR